MRQVPHPLLLHGVPRLAEPRLQGRHVLPRHPHGQVLRPVLQGMYSELQGHPRYRLQINQLYDFILKIICHITQIMEMLRKIREIQYFFIHTYGIDHVC